MDFEIISDLLDIETIATGKSIRVRGRLTKLYGKGRWRKRKGIADVKLADGARYRAEIHWYEAHGIGKRDMKIKKLLRSLKNN
jgi:hypothetical protein